MPRRLAVFVLPVLLLLLAPTAHAADLDLQLWLLEHRLDEVEGRPAAQRFLGPDEYGLFAAAYESLWDQLGPLQEARTWLRDHQPPASAPAVAHRDWRANLDRYERAIARAEARLRAIGQRLLAVRPAGAPFVHVPGPTPGGAFEGLGRMLVQGLTNRVLAPHLGALELFATSLGLPIR